MPIYYKFFALIIAAIFLSIIVTADSCSNLKVERSSKTTDLKPNEWWMYARQHPYTNTSFDAKRNGLRMAKSTLNRNSGGL